MTYQLLNDWSREALQNDLAAIPGPHSYTTPELSGIIEARINEICEDATGRLQTDLSKCATDQEKADLIGRYKKIVEDMRDFDRDWYAQPEGLPDTSSPHEYSIYDKAYFRKQAQTTTGEIFAELLPDISPARFTALTQIIEGIGTKSALLKVYELESGKITTVAGLKAEKDLPARIRTIIHYYRWINGYLHPKAITPRAFFKLVEGKPNSTQYKVWLTHADQTRPFSIEEYRVALTYLEKFPDAYKDISGIIATKERDK